MGDQEEARVSFSFKLYPPALYALQNLAEKEDRTVAYVLRRLIHDYLETNGYQGVKA